MRDNGVITQKEYELDEGITIVSRTDLQGNIVAANESFIEASGYRWTELVGQPHNILRHPDVPPAVFKDFWQTLQAGKPWSQIVKNRRKNGDHYWVVANATPIFEDGKVAGFMSVRTPASRQQVSDAEKAYKAISDGSLEIVGGLPKSTKDQYNPMLQMDQSTITIILAVTLLVSAFAPVVTPSILNVIPLIVFELLDLALVVLLIASSISSQKRLETITKQITSMAEGNFRNNFDSRGKNKISVMASRLKSIQIKFGADMDDIKYALSGAQRIESALKSASTNIVVADRFNSIIFLNNNINQLFEKIEPELKKTLAHFDRHNLIRQDVSVLGLNLKNQNELLSNLKNTYKDRICIGSITIDLTIDPIIDDNGERIGSVFEWVDMTEQLQIEDNINQIIDDASHGSLHKRIDTTELTGFECKISESINRLMNNFSDLISKIDCVFGKLANGDLTERLEGDYVDELLNMQKATNTSLDNLAQTLSQVEKGTNGIKNMSLEVATASEDLSQRTQEQAASLEQTSATMEELTATLKNTALHAIDANTKAHGTSDRATAGIEIMHQTLDAMNGISDLSKKIGEITSVIDSIAFQTNLLALNAAVEAARAGEHGRGFAVVAGEVRNLAGKSAEAAKDISSLISSAISQIDSGTKLVEDTNQVFSEMVTSIEDVEKLINEVASTTEEQSKGVEQVNIAIRQLDEVTQQNAALVEELSSTAGNMSEEATIQNEYVARFEFDHEIEISKSEASTVKATTKPSAIAETKAEAKTVSKMAVKAEPKTKEAKPKDTTKPAARSEAPKTNGANAKNGLNGSNGKNGTNGFNGANGANGNSSAKNSAKRNDEPIKGYTPPQQRQQTAASSDEWQDF